ncbi:hypothetical protein VTO73DRAFT_11973 [Trametes versicolor]
MSSRVTRKRARTDASETRSVANDPSRQHDEEFWYDDGTIILIAGNVEFRVYKGILAEHSPVFSDMFSLPQPPQGAVTPGDPPCPVVHVSDSPEDLRHVLRVYMPKSDPSPFSPDEPTFDAISATIRLGHKYQMSRLVEHSLDYLKQYYTDDFDTWTANDAPGPPEFVARHAIGVVNLARLTGETSILPTAFLSCCSLGADIVDGLVREDGTREHLSMADLGLCFVAKAQLVQEAFENAINVLAPPVSAQCTSPSQCRKRLAHYTKFLAARGTPIAFKGPLYSIVRMLWPPHVKRDQSFCAFCWTMLDERDVNQRRALWKALTDVLGLTDGTSETADEEDSNEEDEDGN